MEYSKTAPEHVYNAPVSSVGDNSPQAVVNDRTGLFIAIFALAMAGLALGISVTSFVIVPQMIDAKVAAGMAEAKATANAAREHARIALDKVEQTQVQLGAKGLVQPSTH